MLRCPRTFGRRLLPLHHWLCSIGRRKPKHLCGTPCHTVHRSESWALPSLCRATPSATSERFLGLIDSTSIPPSSLLLAFPFNRGSFARPALPGFLAHPSLSVTPYGPTCLSRDAS